MNVKKRVKSFFLRLLSCICIFSCLPLLYWIIQDVGSMNNIKLFQTAGEKKLTSDYSSQVNNIISTALDGLVSIPKIYVLSDELIEAPEPNNDNFGASSNSLDTVEIVAQVEEQFHLDSTVWNVNRQILPGSRILWYLDDTIFSISWKQVYEGAAFSFTEIVIAHPSQFRRFLAEDTFGAPRQYFTTEMAASVHAVSALSADFYKFRTLGTVVYHGKLCRMDGKNLDVCYVDTSGNLNLVPRGELLEEKDMLRYIEENDITFSLSFGPAMILDGEICIPDYYPVGEITGEYSRCCLCQVDDLHYLLVTSNQQPPYTNRLTLQQFTQVVFDQGVVTAYALDGGQTATMYTSHQLFNAVDFGSERVVSDIIYFATALPEEEWR